MPNTRLQPTPAKNTRGQALAKAQREDAKLQFRIPVKMVTTKRTRPSGPHSRSHRIGRTPMLIARGTG
jgi:ribosomal protein L13E